MNRTSFRQSGFTLVEILIGMLIGVIGIVVIMQTFAVSEGYKRTATSGTDAQVNGGIATYLMERELRIAGFNITQLAQVGCTSVVVYNTTTSSSTLMRWVPVEINPAGYAVGDANTDVILIAYGNADSFVSGVPVNQVAASTDRFDIAQNKDGFRNGDLVVGVQPGAGPGGTPLCVMHELTGVPSAGGNCGVALPPNSSYLDHKTAVYKSLANLCNNTTPTHNSATGIITPSGTAVPKLTQNTGAALYDMGGGPNVKVYAIRSGNLTSCDAIAKDCTVGGNYDILVDNIVSMRAIIGGDYVGAPPAGSSALGDGVVDQWSRTAIGSNNDVLRTLAIAIELTSRSTLKEKPSNGGTVCDATLDPTRPDRAQTTDWYAAFNGQAVGSLAGAQINVSGVGADWACYRYKLFQTVVPLRNLVWRP